jgi:hypothetical protein
MTDYALVLSDVYPDRQFSVGDGYDTIRALDGGAVPSQEELDGAWPAVQTARLNAQAAADRAAAYAVEADPLFFYWQAGEGSEGAWLAKRAEIRGRFPYVEVSE